MAKVIIPYSPRPLQRQFHEERTRFCVMVCHRRFGKTVAAINDLIREAVRAGKNDWRAAYAAPFYGQAKAVAWDYLKLYAGVIPGTKFNEAELRCDLPTGARIRLYGVDNANALRGLYLDDLVLDEPADMAADVWSKVLRPALADRKGRALFIGTPNGTENLLYDVWEYAGKGEDAAWSRFCFRASETGYVDAKELAAAKADMDEDEYAQEFECSFSAAVRGAYYSQQIEQLEAMGKITGVPYDPAAPVFTAWDLGMDDSTAIWVAQSVGREVHIIDYYECSGQALAHYADWWRSRGYGKAVHYLPHDARARELGTGKSREEVLVSLDIGTISIVPMQSVEDGINAARTLLPLCWFDAKLTMLGLSALRNYKREWISKHSVFSSRPLHDWSSHAADAFRYLALSAQHHRAASTGGFTPRRKHR